MPSEQTIDPDRTEAYEAAKEKGWATSRGIVKNVIDAAIDSGALVPRAEHERVKDRCREQVDELGAIKAGWIGDDDLEAFEESLVPLTQPVSVGLPLMRNLLTELKRHRNINLLQAIQKKDPQDFTEDDVLREMGNNEELIKRAERAEEELERVKEEVALMRRTVEAVSKAQVDTVRELRKVRTELGQTMMERDELRDRG